MRDHSSAWWREVSWEHEDSEALEEHHDLLSLEESLWGSPETEVVLG